MLNLNMYILDIIKTELNEIKENYGDERRTAFETDSEDFDIEDLKLKKSDKEGIVKNFFIDGKYFDFDNKHKVYSNKNIVIEYHTLERIAFTYSSKTIIGKDYKEVVKFLKKKAFLILFVNLKKI